MWDIPMHCSLSFIFCFAFTSCQGFFRIENVCDTAMCIAHIWRWKCLTVYHCQSWATSAIQSNECHCYDKMHIACFFVCITVCQIAPDLGWRTLHFLLRASLRLVDATKLNARQMDFHEEWHRNLKRQDRIHCIFEFIHDPVWVFVFTGPYGKRRGHPRPLWFTGVEIHKRCRRLDRSRWQGGTFLFHCVPCCRSWHWKQWRKVFSLHGCWVIVASLLLRHHCVTCTVSSEFSLAWFS